MPNDFLPAGLPSSGLPTTFVRRVGDLERAAVCDQLAAQFAAGRLDGDELDQRVGAAMTALTLHDLHALVSDLPPLPGRPALATAARASQPWTGWDVLVLMTLIGALLTALLGMTVAGVTARGDLFVVALLSTLVAGTIGATATHLVHRSAARHRGPRD